MQDLLSFLASVPPGPIADKGKLEASLILCWHKFEGSDEERMYGGKLRGRIETPTWNPPVLSFKIERHGATVLGSTRASRLLWELNTEYKTAECSEVGFRQIKPTEPRLDVRLIADELAARILNHREDERLAWKKDGAVHVIMVRTVGGYNWTFQGRRKRLLKALDDRLCAVGWRRLHGNIYAPPRQGAQGEGGGTAGVKMSRKERCEGKKQDISYFSLNKIRPAPENRLLYERFAPGVDEDDFQLCLSIKAEGIREPLHISADDFLLSGHRRHAAARYLGLKTVPCVVVADVVFGDLSADERLGVLSTYNKQRDKSHAERLREALVKIDPEEAYERLLQDRDKRRHVDIEDNVVLGDFKGRARITTTAFLVAAQDAILSEAGYWPLTVRRVHYLLLNDPPLRHDRKPGSTYKNDLGSYKALTNLLLRARLTGDIPHAAIEDETRPISAVATYQSPAEYIKEQAEEFLRYYARDLLRGQARHVEILVEKNAIRKHIELVAEEYCIPCTTGRGYSSLTPRWKMVQRFQGSGKEQMVFLILSDFDPDGEEIAASFPRSLRDDFGLSNILAHKVAISGADVRDHGLPSDLEAKVSSPNYQKFVERHGVHVAELDAAPVALLQGKLRDAIEGCLDMDVFRAELAKEKEDYAFVAATKKMVLKAIR